MTTEKTSVPELSRRCLLAGLAAMPIAGVASRALAQAPTALELATDAMRPIAGSTSLWQRRIAPGLWVYSGTAPFGGGHYPYNGMLAVDGEGSILIDTGWSPEHGRALLGWAEAEGNPVRIAVATHFHEDRTGGIPALRRAGVPVVAHPMTTGLARAYGAPEPDPLPLLARGPVDLGPVELFFPGAGHAPDNITAWHRGSRILCGGCFIKSATSSDIGNLQDAVVGRWAQSIATLRRRYRDIAAIIPGHGTMAGDPLGRTMELLGAG